MKPFLETKFLFVLERLEIRFFWFILNQIRMQYELYFTWNNLVILLTVVVVRFSTIESDHNKWPINLSVITLRRFQLYIRAQIFIGPRNTFYIWSWDDTKTKMFFALPYLSQTMFFSTKEIQFFGFEFQRSFATKKHEWEMLLKN